MDSNIISGLIGVCGALLGTAMGSYIQWKFNTRNERIRVNDTLIDTLKY